MSYHQPDAPQVNPYDPVFNGEAEPDEHEDEADELNEPAIIPPPL